MFTYQEVKDALAKTPIEKLAESYTLRQQENLKEDKRIIEYVAEKLQFITFFLGEEMDNTQIILSAISMAMKVGGPLKATALNTLYAYGYKTAGELLKTMQLADNYYSSELDFPTYNSFAHSSITLRDTTIIHDKITVLFDGCHPTILEAITKKEDLSPDKRRQHCHDLTSSILLENPDLVGAYYYIPLFFCGSIEHSVLIDEDRKMVYDMANNIALPLSVWQKYYPTYSFAIKGKDFKDISDRIYDDFGERIVTANLEEIKRQRKK